MKAAFNNVDGCIDIVTFGLEYIMQFQQQCNLFFFFFFVFCFLEAVLSYSNFDFLYTVRRCLCFLCFCFMWIEISSYHFPLREIWVLFSFNDNDVNWIELKTHCYCIHQYRLKILWIFFFNKIHFFFL